jgi:acid phosphatase
MKKRLLLPLVAVLFATACASTPSASPPAAAPLAVSSPAAVAVSPSAAATVAADDNLNATLWTQRAIERDLVTRAIYRNAAEKLDAALADPGWDALAPEERDRPVAGLPPAVILDVDEAALDNSPYQARLVRSGEEYSEFSWAEWCKEKRARPIPGAIDFTRSAAERGIAVFYLSNRAKDLQQVTLENLRAAGFPVAGDDAFLGLGVVLPGCEQLGTEKGCRRRLVGRSHRVLMQVGDQIGDFVEVVANTNAGRAEAMAPFLDWVGERWWPLPNPNYGSWEPAQFNNYWRQSREARRKAKIEALFTE